MNGLFADLTVELGQYRSHGSHAFFTAIFLFIPYVTGFQHPYILIVRMFRSIALGGGGVRGGLMVGGLAALRERQELVFPDGIYGCSAGSVVATAVAYNLPLDVIRTMFENDFNLSSVIPSINLTTVTAFTTEKGLFSMDSFTECAIKAFDKAGVDLRTATIADAPQKLYIMAANLTTRRTVFFSGKVPILAAMRASCCLPFVFHPQIIYNNVYVDGGFFDHNMHKIVPSDCLVYHISRADLLISPDRLKSMKLSDYAATIYEAMRIESHTNTVVWFKNDSISLLQELTPENKKMLYDQGFSQASRFFAKRFPEIVC